MKTVETLCVLCLALGEPEACPGKSCQLWHDGACVLQSVGPELGGSPVLARNLLDLKEALEQAASADDVTHARTLFARRLIEEQAAES